MAPADDLQGRGEDWHLVDEGEGNDVLGVALRAKGHPVAAVVLDLRDEDGNATAPAVELGEIDVWRHGVRINSE